MGILEGRPTESTEGTEEIFGKRRRYLRGRKAKGSRERR